MQSSSPQSASPQPLSSQRRGLKARAGAFLAHDGLPVGGIAVAVMLGTYALLALPPSGPLLTLACCGTVLIYQLDRLLGFSPEDAVNRPDRTRWMQAHRSYVVITMAGAVVVGGAMLMVVRPITALVGVGLGAVGLLHVWPVAPGGRRLKAWGWIKPVAISGAWAAGAVLVPVLEADQPLSAGVWALAAYRFGIVGVNTLLADWSDRAGDARAGLQTIATEKPAGFVFYGAYSILALLLGGGLSAVVVGQAPSLLLIDLIGVLLLGAVVRCVQRDAAWAHHIAVDAVVAWPVVTFLVAWIGGG